MTSWTNEMNNTFEYLTSYELTNKGNLRPQNEDALLSLREYGLFCVADGMGGHKRGEFASSCAIQTLQQAFINTPAEQTGLQAMFNRADLVENALNQASHTIKAHALSSGISTIGTTTVVLLFDPSDVSRAQVFHAGDSRAYLFRNNNIIRLTRDHSIAEAVGIADEESLPMIFRGVITRAVGIEAKVMLEITPTDVRPNDIFLLCSDGLTRMVNEQTLLNLLNANQKQGLSFCANALIDKALSQGGLDNISVILVRVDPEFAQQKTA